MKYPCLLFLLLTSSLVHAQATLYGKVTDEETEEELIGANVIAYQNGVIVSGTSTDFDGNYQLELDPGIYHLEVRYVGYPSSTVDGVLVKEGQRQQWDVGLGRVMEPIIISYYMVIHKVPLLQVDAAGPTPISDQKIERQPVKEVRELMVNFPGVSVGR
ncbi:MAG: carboxypeptidase regulatory-like domain-containing protein [Bacteroidota bacterium]